MKHPQLTVWHALICLCMISLVSCKKTEKKITLERTRVEMNARWDEHPNAQALKILKPYEAAIDSMMKPVIGKSAIEMTVARPECTLGNLVADVLRQSATPYIGKPADIALMNIGGLRTNLSKGEVTVRSVYEILPFQNSLCILTIEGKYVKELANDIAIVGGESISNMQIKADKNGVVTSVTVAGKPVDDNTRYTLATIDYLSEGNDRMVSLLKAEKKLCMEEATIREIFINYIKAEAAKGKMLTSKLEQRVYLAKEK